MSRLISRRLKCCKPHHARPRSSLAGRQDSLSTAVAKAAEVLDYRNKPGMILVVTDGEETCGASPCALGKELRATAAQLTVHIIGFRMKDYSWTGRRNRFLEAEMPR